MRYLVALCALALFLTTAVRADDAFQSIVPGIEGLPGPDAALPPGEPSLQVRFSGDLLPTASQAQVWIDDEEITEGLLRDGAVLFVPLPDGLAGGAHTARVTVPVMTGGTRTAAWSFTIGEATGPPGAVKVTVDPARGTLYQGDLLTVTAKGPPGGKAFCVVDRRIRVDLPEVSAGIYQGTYTVTQADYVMSGSVVVTLTQPDGTATAATAAAPVKIFGQLFTVRVISPVSGARVPWDFVIRGRTRPGARVSIAPNLGGPAQNAPVLGTRPPPMGQSTSNMGTIECVADATGVFEQKFGFPLRIVPVRYSFFVSARGPGGEEAIPSSFSVVIGGAEK